MSRILMRILVGTLGMLVLMFVTSAQQPSAQAPAAGGAATALTGVRIIDGSGRAPIENGTIVIRDGTIAAVGAGVQVPTGATRVDLAGKTVMPGMINAHGHVQHQTKTMPMRDDLVRRLRTYAAYGVTTVVSLGQTSMEEQAAVIALRDEQDRVALDRARVYTSGPSIRNQKTPGEARQTVNRHRPTAANCISDAFFIEHFRQISKFFQQSRHFSVYFLISKTRNQMVVDQTASLHKRIHYS